MALGWPALPPPQGARGLGSSIPLSQPLPPGRTEREEAQLICVFLADTRFHHVNQAGLELLILTSQSAGFAGVSHCSWPVNVCVFFLYLVVLITYINYKFNS